MTSRPPAETGWFQGLDPGDTEASRDAIEDGSAEEPADWPALAVDTGFAPDADEYYDALHEATVGATREAVRERERDDDQQLVHAVRSMDDIARKLV